MIEKAEIYWWVRVYLGYSIFVSSWKQYYECCGRYQYFKFQAVSINIAFWGPISISKAFGKISTQHRTKLVECNHFAEKFKYNAPKLKMRLRKMVAAKVCTKVKQLETFDFSNK